ncbi:hypothetical protein FACS1894192_03620 [Bacilli bacterium]|nr:hypothetical protein FACS1894192_03620 [Bacilli bacterium]
MKTFNNDTRQIGYRSWKSGKKWLYASSALVAIIGATALETTGTTPKILSYIQKNFGTDSVEAMSSIPTILNYGEVLQSDFYASVSDFSVPNTVGTDFANNATKVSTGSINPYFQGSTYVIPSAANSNAIAAFNQPLDPSKNFSISAEITVPDARIAAAGVYISDVPPEEITGKLGDKGGNVAGSSGALRTDKASYDGHYMLFSGFHNTSGYAAILASGTDYTRLTAGGSPSGASKYMDDDYVAFGTNRNNVKIWATIDYNAATGVATVIYKHNSATTSNATNYRNNGYTTTNKTATVQFQIDRSSPVYLGIVGNGDKNDPNGNFTSRSTVTSVTGTYLTSNRNVEFRDEAGNTLALMSRVLMPRGGRLGIGNGDTTTPYYFDKPDMPSGYTYLASLNPTTSIGNATSSTGRVIYKRDLQQGVVNHINQLTGKNIGTDTWTALTNESLTNTTPALSGYYMIDTDAIVGSGVSNVSTSADASKVTWTNKVDDTANGTSTTDSNPQEANAYVMPSIQERILTINKPDGTVVTEKQTSTTDTDFSSLGGQYVIPGYRAVVDGTPVTDAEMLQGIPGEATDKTHNLKNTTDSVPQTHTITYHAEPQSAHIVYKDVTTGTILQTDTIMGVSDTLLPYDTAYTVESYRRKGYILKATNFTDNAEKFDNDSSVDQNYLIEFVHDTQSSVDTKRIKHEVIYTVADGLVAAPTDYVVEANISDVYFIDKMTGARVSSNFGNYAVGGDANVIPQAPEFKSDNPEVSVATDGNITFAQPLVPVMNRYTAKTTENRTILFSNASDGQVLTSKVVYSNQGDIQLTQVPDINFGNQLISAKNKGKLYSAVYSTDLIIDDNRKDIKDGWHLTVQQTTPFKSADGLNTLTNSLFFRSADNNPLSSLEGGVEVVVYDHTSAPGSLGILESIKPTSNWNKTVNGAGFYLKDNGKVKAEDYSTVLTWTLGTGPSA